MAKEAKKTYGSYVHIDTFLETAKVVYEMTDIQVAGFKAYMGDTPYLHSDAEFIEPLKTYLGKGD